MIPLRDELPSRRRPYVTIALICANVLVFFFQSSQGREFTAGLARWSPDWARLTTGQQRALSRYGIIIDENIPKSEKFAAAIEQNVPHNIEINATIRVVLPPMLILLKRKD